MADTKISDLTAVTTPDPTDEFAVNQGGVSKSVTGAQFMFTAGAYAPAPRTGSDGPSSQPCDACSRGAVTVTCRGLRARLAHRGRWSLHDDDPAAHPDR